MPSGHALKAYAARTVVERDEWADAAILDRQRRDDRRAQRAAQERARQARLDVHAVAVAGRAGQRRARVINVVMSGAGAVEGEQQLGAPAARERRGERHPEESPRMRCPSDRSKRSRQRRASPFGAAHAPLIERTDRRAIRASLPSCDSL
jgi:hypothetical protein